MKKTTASFLVLCAIVLTVASSASAISIPSLFTQTGTAIKNIIYPDMPVYPSYRIEVKSPNGGEVWDKSRIQEIKWQVYWPMPIPATENSSLQQGKALVSIDLYEKPYIRCLEEEPRCLMPESSPVFVKHIDTVNAWDKGYSWKISNDIPNGKRYLVRITPQNAYIAGINPGADYKNSQSANIISSYWDESDGVFKITGNIANPDLREMIKILEQKANNLESQLQELLKIIALLKQMAENQ